MLFRMHIAHTLMLPNQRRLPADAFEKDVRFFRCATLIPLRPTASLYKAIWQQCEKMPDRSAADAHARIHVRSRSARHAPAAMLARKAAPFRRYFVDALFRRRRCRAARFTRPIFSPLVRCHAAYAACSSPPRCYLCHHYAFRHATLLFAVFPPLRSDPRPAAIRCATTPAYADARGRECAAEK